MSKANTDAVKVSQYECWALPKQWKTNYDEDSYMVLVPFIKMN